MSQKSLRIDKWLWFARFAKSRTAAQALAKSGRIRVNRLRTNSASRTIKVDDVLTIATQIHVRVVRVLSIGTRRGPAPEARALYEDIGPAPGPSPVRHPPLGSAHPRPDKRERRALMQLKHGGP